MSPTNDSDFAGAVGVEYVYGSLGRLAAKVDKEWWGSTVTAQARYTYDAPYAGDGASYGNTFGALASATTWEGEGGALSLQNTLAFGYDARGRLQRRDQWFTGLGGTAPDPSGRQRSELEYGYDGRVLSVTHTSAALGAVTFTHGYDPAGRLVRVTQGAATLWDVKDGADGQKFDALGRPTLIELDDAHLRQTHAYDPTTGLETAFWSARRASTGTAWTGATALYDARSITYEGVKLKSLEELVSGTRFDASYDASGRLTGLNASAASSLATMVPELARRWTETYSYALDGSMTPTAASLWTLSKVQGQRDGQPTLDVYSYKQSMPDQLQSLGATTVKSDAQRRGLIVQAPGGAALLTLGYDTQNRLKRIAANGVLEEELGYDAMGALARRSLPGQNAFRYHAGEAMTVEVKGGVTTAWAHLVVGGVRVASVWGAGGSGGVLYYHRDRLGSVVATTTAGGGEGVQYRYDAFGTLVAQKGVESGGNASELGYTGGLSSHGLRAPGWEKRA